MQSVSFLFFLLPEIYIWVMLEMSKRDTHTGLIGQFFCKNSLLFCFILPRSESSLFYIIFQIPMQILMVTPPTYTLHMDMLSSSIPPMQFMWHFLRGTICIQLTLGNRCTSSYAAYVAFLLGNNLLSVYSRKQSYFLLCQPFNLHGISAGEQPASDLFQETGVLPVMPPMQLM